MFDFWDNFGFFTEEDDGTYSVNDDTDTYDYDGYGLTHDDYDDYDSDDYDMDDK